MAIPKRLEAAVAARMQQRLDRIENYVFIGGPRLTARQAAERLGVSRKTIERYRATLREAP